MPTVCSATASAKELHGRWAQDEHLLAVARNDQQSERQRCIHAQQQEGQHQRLYAHSLRTLRDELNDEERVAQTQELKAGLVESEPVTEQSACDRLRDEKRTSPPTLPTAPAVEPPAPAGEQGAGLCFVDF